MNGFDVSTTLPTARLPLHEQQRILAEHMRRASLRLGKPMSAVSIDDLTAAVPS